jgi:signal transduction histidine kinase
MRRSGKAMIEEVSNQRASRQEYREYIESWVHEMKAPITAAGLIANNTEPEIRRKLATELANIENHVERALYYARAESAETDFIIRQTSLHEIVSGAVEKHRTLLLQSEVQVETDDLDRTVYTDGKWAIFIIGQLLQNAVRYRSEEPLIQFYTKALGEQTQLVVQDNGIGIPPHELPRIFERGFTGSNGRQRGGSTGMGLYIAHKLADHMLMDIQAISESGEGTAITMTFPAKANLTKV